MKIKDLLQTLIKPQEHSLKIQSIRSAVWSMIGRGGGHILRMVGSLILTRVLFPEAFGLMATATVALSMVNLFSDTGVKTAIVQNPRGDNPEFLNTAWIISSCRGILLFIILIILAVPLSKLYNEPELKTLLIIIAFNPIILGFENPSLTLFIKKFRLEKRVLFEIVTQALGLSSSIILALLLRSVYALAFGTALSALYRTIGSHLITSYHPKLAWDHESGKDLFHFGKYIFLNTMITWAVLNVDIILIGKLLGMDILGFYNLGKNYAYLVITFCLQIVSQAYMPAVSSVFNDKERIVTIYQRTVALFLSIAIPFSMVLILFSHDIIRLLYDARYQTAYISMSWLNLSGIFQFIGIITGTTFIAMGRPVIETVSVAIGLIAGILFIFIGISLGDLQGVSAGMAAALSLTAIMESIFLFREMHFPLKIIIRPWIQAISLILLIGGVYILLKPWFFDKHVHNLPFMFVIMIVGILFSGVIYILLEGTHPFRDRRGSLNEPVYS